MRTFIALNLDKYAHAAFTDTITAYKANLPVNTNDLILPENFHITLAFLGEIDRLLLPQLSENLQVLANTLKPFAICLRELKYFPSEEHPKVLAAIIDDTPELMDLEQRVVLMLKNMNINYSIHHQFRPHLSVAYCKDNHRIIPMLPKMLLNISSTINAIRIFEVHTEHSNDRYEKIGDYSMLSTLDK